MTPQQEKAIKIAQAIVNTAYGISDTLKLPVPHAVLLRKQAFPDRKTPHRIKRNRKKTAKHHQSINVAVAATRMFCTAMQIKSIAEAPIPKYPSGTNQA